MVKYNQHAPFLDSEPGNNRAILPEYDETHSDYTPGLKECIYSAPRLTGCEAAHFFPVDINICSSNGPGYDDEERGINPVPSFKVSETGQRPAENEGNLVIHVRSGDIFTGYAPRNYGQVSDGRC